MKHTLQVQICAREGAVLRTLGLVERRGFRIESLNVAEAQGDGQAMRLTVRSDRSIALLKRQLERLHDVIWVEMESDGPAAGGLTKHELMGRGVQPAGVRPVTRRS
ncbi:MAG: ACT domain-containing protein [Xanthomonadales bacterium]|jgi:acetolactate synthase regulatory subunit|nr:ACT domain-containing protein [Xanthomonadales bacterium]